MSLDQRERVSGFLPFEEEELTLTLPRRAMERLFVIARFTHAQLDTFILDAFRRLFTDGNDKHPLG